MSATDAEKALWQDYSSHKNLTVKIYSSDGTKVDYTLTNTDIKSEGMTLTQTLEADDCLSFMGCNASVFELEVKDLSTDVRGCRLTASIKVGDYTRALFDGIVEEQENRTHEDVLTTITAYDWMRQINQLDCTDWAKNTLGSTYTITGKTPLLVMQKFYSDVIKPNLPYVSISSEYFGDWNNTAFTSEADFTNYDSITGEMIMKWLCQVGNIYGYMLHALNGAFLAFKRLEAFTEALYPAISLYPSASLYPSKGLGIDETIDKASYISLDYEPYKVAKIDSVAITDSDGTLAEGIAPNGTVGDNCYYIDANPFSWAMNMSTLAQNIYDRVCDIAYTPIDIECVGMPYLLLGDVVRASTKKRTVYSYILKRTMKGIQALTDEYESDSDQYQSEHAETYSSISSTDGQKILRIQADVVSMNTLIAQRATISELNTTKGTLETLIASKATISELNTTKGTLETLIASKATITDLNSATARIGTLETNSLTASNINAASFTLSSGHIGNLDASKITSGTISADRIDTSAFGSKTISCNGVSCKSITASNGITTAGLNVNGTAAIWKTTTVAGTTLHYLGY